MRKWSWRILPSPIHHPQTSQLPGWSPPPSAGRHRPPGPGSPEIRAGTRTAPAPCAAAREAPRGPRRAGGCTGSGRESRPPPPRCGRRTTAAASRAREAPARDPASAPHPFLADSRPRPRDGAENPGISRSPRRQFRRVAAARPAVPSPAPPSPGPR